MKDVVLIGYLGFFQTVSGRPALRKALTPSKINEIQDTLYLLFSALKMKGYFT